MSIDFTTLPFMVGIALIALAVFGGSGGFLGVTLGRSFSREYRIGFAVIGVLLLLPGVLGGFGFASFG